MKAETQPQTPLQGEVRISWKWIAIIIIVAYALFTRFYALGVKPLHHDESLFTFYSYHLSQNGVYIYQPILHGPFLLEMTTLVYILLGDSDFTMRFLPACFGIGIMLMMFAFRRRLGERGMIASLLLIALSPTLMYYSRFYRNDMPFAFVTLVVLYFYIRFFTQGGGWALALAILSTMWLICIKENSLIFLFTIWTFAVLIVLIDLVKTTNLVKRTKKAIRKPAAEQVRPADWGWIALSSLCLVALSYLFYKKIFQSSFLLPNKMLVGIFGFEFIVLVLLVWFLVLCVRRNYGEDHLIRRLYEFTIKQWAWLLIGLLLSFILYMTIFTTFFTNPMGPFKIYEQTFNYWWGQHGQQRIKGAFHYYLPILAIYEVPALLLITFGLLVHFLRDRRSRWFVIPAWILLTVLGYLIFRTTALNLDFWDKKFHIQSKTHIWILLTVLFFGILATVQYLWRKERFKALLVYWTAMSFLIYSYAGEKVPWVAVHIVLPMLLLAGLYCGEFLETEAFHRLKPLWITIFAILIIWTVKSGVVLCFYNYDNTAERMIYGHTTRDVKRVAQEIDRIAFLLGMKETMGTGTPVEVTRRLAEHLADHREMQVLVKGEVIWPMRWYLRHYEQSGRSTWTEWENPATTRYPVLLLDWKDAQQIDNVKNNYRISKYMVRTWWQPKVFDMKRLLDIWKSLTPKQHRPPYLVEEIQKSKQEWKYVLNYLIYRRAFETEGARWPTMSSVDFAFCVRKDLLNLGP